MSILVIDVGTQSIRGILFDKNGVAVLKEQREYSLINRGDTIVEQDTDPVLDALKDILQKIGTRAKTGGYSVCALSVTAQRSSVIPLDKNGRALRYALMWQDKRSAEICAGFADQHAEIYGICGMKPTPVFSAPKMLWLKRNEPHLYESSYKLAGFCEFVLFHLTGGFYTDSSIASRTCLFDIKKLQWSETLLKLFEVDRTKLCDLVPVGSVCAETTAAVTSLLGLNKPVPVISAGGDQQCAALGVGCTGGNSIEINAGTGSYAIALSDKPVYDKKMRVMCNVAAVPGNWIVEGALLSAGITVSWLDREFFADKTEKHPFENFDLAVRDSPVGANGLLMSSAFAGKGTPFWDPYARGCILNMGFNNTKKDFARALLEGIAADAVECLDIIDELLGGKMEKKVRCAGGLTKSAAFNRIQADTYGRTVEKYEASSEATALGAFISAAVTLGFFGTYAQAFAAITEGRAKEEFHPVEAHHRQYEKMREARRQFINSMDNRDLYMIMNT